jgi:NAD(P)H-nitrite reductase large subunit
VQTLIVGSGLGVVSVAEALGKGARQDVMLVTAETSGYYSRPRLSHGIALGDDAAAKIVLKRFDSLAGVRVLAGVQAWRLDRPKRAVILESGERLAYDKLVLATGSAARIPPVLAVSRPNFLLLNSYEDLLTLRRRRAKVLARGAQPRWAVIGGGLIGCELASDLNKAGDGVTIFHRESRLVELQLSEPQSRSLHEHLAAKGVVMRYGEDVRAVYPGVVLTAAGEVGPFDGIIVSTGFAPRIELAKEAGLETARGIVVDEYLRTADPAIYAVGDVAEVRSRLYAFVSPIRSQALWLAEHLLGRTEAPWAVPAFTPVLKVHGFKVEPSGNASIPGVAPRASLPG